MIESGNNQEISYEVDSTAEKGFFRLIYTDQVPGPGETIESADFDGDGLTNLEEITGGSFGIQTNPSLSDSDHDGFQDRIEFTSGTNPSNPNDTISYRFDSDGDGVTDANERRNNTNPNDPSDTPEEMFRWYWTQKNHEHRERNLDDRSEFTTSTIFSNSIEEYHNELTPTDVDVPSKSTFEASWPSLPFLRLPTKVDLVELQDGIPGGPFGYGIAASWSGSLMSYYHLWGGFRETQSQIKLVTNFVHDHDVTYNFLKFVTVRDYKVTDSEESYGAPGWGTSHLINESYKVESAKIVIPAGQSISGFPIIGGQPVEVLKIDNSDKIDPADLTTRTVELDFLRVDIQPADNMSGVIGDVVKSTKPDSAIKHFVTPKASGPLVGPPLPIDQQYVILKVVGVTAKQITPGNAREIVEWEGGEAIPNEPLKRKVKRDTAAKIEIKIKVKQGGATAAQMNVWVTWADLTLENNTPVIQPSVDNGREYILKGKISYRYICTPNAMFDKNQDIPNLNIAPNPQAPGGNHPWPPHEPLANGAAVRYDATRQVRAVLNSSDHVVLGFEREAGYTDIPDFPQDIAMGNDDPNMGTELMPYQGDFGSQGVMTDIDSPLYFLKHERGLPNSTFSLHAQFRQYARVQIGRKWFRCSDLKLSDLKLKFKKTNGKWSNDGSTFVTGNGPFPTP